MLVVGQGQMKNQMTVQAVMSVVWKLSLLVAMVANYELLYPALPCVPYCIAAVMEMMKSGAVG